MEQNTKEPNREAEMPIACHEEVVANLKAELAALRRDVADITEIWGQEITDYLEARRAGRDAAMKETNP